MKDKNWDKKNIKSRRGIKFYRVCFYSLNFREPFAFVCVIYFRLIDLILKRHPAFRQ